MLLSAPLVDVSSLSNKKIITRLVDGPLGGLVVDQWPTDATCLFLDKSDGEFSTNDNHTFVQSNLSPAFVVLLFTFKLLNLLALGLTVVTLVASCNPDLLKDDLQTGITFTLDQNGSSSYYSWDQMNSRGIHTPTNKKFF